VCFAWSCWRTCVGLCVCTRAHVSVWRTFATFSLALAAHSMNYCRSGFANRTGLPLALYFGATTLSPAIASSQFNVTSWVGSAGALTVMYTAPFPLFCAFTQSLPWCSRLVYMTSHCPFAWHAKRHIVLSPGIRDATQCFFDMRDDTL
jgi:hypothetical protein